MTSERLTAADLLNFLASGAEVLAENEVDPGRLNPLRCVVLAERIADLAEEYPAEIEAALALARANGLLAERVRVD